jgi:SnoaL-like polyketide cyclase
VRGKPATARTHLRLQSAELVDRCPSAPVELRALRGPEGLKRSVSMYRAAFPKVRMVVDEVIAAGDTVVLRWHSDGTHRGELAGLARTRCVWPSSSSSAAASLSAVAARLRSVAECAALPIVRLSPSPRLRAVCSSVSTARCRLVDPGGRGRRGCVGESDRQCPASAGAREQCDANRTVENRSGDQGTVRPRTAGLIVVVTVQRASKVVDMAATPWNTMLHPPPPKLGTDPISLSW